MTSTFAIITCIINLMSVNNTSMTKQLIGRVISPSISSLLAGFFISTFLTGWQFIKDTAGSNGSENTETLEAIITQPIVALLRNDSFNDVVLAILFGLVGLVCYTIIEILVGIYHSYRNQKSLVHFEGRNQTLSVRPASKVLLSDWMWRFMVVLGLIMFTFISMFVFSYITNSKLLIEQPDFVRFFANVVLYMLILHVYLVFLRLYIRRTRVFEELLF